MKKNEIVTVPNLITLVRLLCLPLFVWLIFSKGEVLQAAWLLAVLGATDWVDGYFARRFNQVSVLGKVLDPLADRLMLVTAVITMLIKGYAPAWVLIAVGLREVAVSVAVLTLAVQGVKRIDVSWWGKAGTFGLMFAFPPFIAASVTEGAWHVAYSTLAWVCVAGGLPLSYIAAFAYIPVVRAARAEGRTAPSE